MALDMTRMAATAVIGRDEELDSLDTFLGEVDDGPTALVLSGEPGIGKTILWEAAIERARGRADCVLAHRSVEAEASLSFAGLSDLVAPILDELASSIVPPRRRALEVALLLAEPGPEAPDPRAIGLALLDVLRALAERGPVVLALDDVQWLDPSSAGVLQMALRRLRDERVGLLATLRTERDMRATLELEQAFHEERRRRLTLSPLSLGALHRLLRERLDLALARPDLWRIRETSGGNPFFALEIARELLRTHTRPEAGRTLPVPHSLHELLGGRLARLPTDAGDVLLLAAALARPTVALVAETHGNPEDALAALAAAESEGVLELDDTHVRFAHPLVASICYDRAPPWKRRAVHRVLAGAVADVEERARHLALAADGPDAPVAASLDAAADRAGARGAPVAAAELCELAARLTPEDDPSEARGRRRRAAGFHQRAGAGERAAELLNQLLVDVPAGIERADVLFALALLNSAGPGTTLDLCDEALAEAAGDDARSARILGYRAWIRLFQADVRSALVDARAALEKAERIGDPTLLAGVIGQVATVEGRAAEITPGLVERGAEIEERLRLRLAYHESPRVALARRLTGLGQLEPARAIVEEAGREAAARGNEELRGQLLGRLAVLEWLAGRWKLALDHIGVADEIWEQTQGGHAPHLQALARYIRALVNADLGLADQARTWAEKGLAISRTMADEEWTILTLGALGRLELALGNLEAAGENLRELPGRLLSLGYDDPIVPIWADAIEALVGLGELEQAATYLARYETHAQRIESPLAAGGAQRCRGLLAAAEGDTESAFHAFERGLAELEGLPYPLDRGRTLLCLGSARRQAKQKRLARDAIEQALAIFDGLDARLWADKARAELGRISGRRRTSADEPTVTELRVAALAADGRSNKQIAAELFMSVHTVGAHLSRVYRKLGISSRSGLASRLAETANETASVSGHAPDA
jgi:DNA-binding CsgD family transcriptional regulator